MSAKTVPIWYCFRMPGRLWDSVVEVAVEHGGYITPRLATPAGIPAIELRKMVSRGTLIQAGHGIYRVPSLPIDRYDEFFLANLWTAGRGVISHDSALLIHDLCDINPERVHITIPRTYRIERSGSDPYVVHRANLTDDEITMVDGVALTTVRRTLTDAVETVPTYLVRRATATAIERGLIEPPANVAKLQRKSAAHG